MGKLLGIKSDIVSCLEKLTTMTNVAMGNPTIDAVILDDAVIVNMFNLDYSLRYSCHNQKTATSCKKVRCYVG